MMAVSEYTILLIEDDVNDILLIERAFKQTQLKNRVLNVRDGDEAIAYLSGEDEYGDRENYPLPALILLDLKLPRLSGLEVLSWLRQQANIKRIPVVILTSSKESLDVEKAYDIGVNSYLIKPVQFEYLKQMMKTFNDYWLNFNQYPTGISA